MSETFCLAWLPLSWSFGCREQAFVEAVLSVPIGVSELLASSVPSLGCVKPKDNPGTSPRVVLESQCSLPNLHFSLHFSESSYVCFKYNVQRF